LKKSGPPVKEIRLFMQRAESRGLRSQGTGLRAQGAGRRAQGTGQRAESIGTLRPLPSALRHKKFTSDN